MNEQFAAPRSLTCRFHFEDGPARIATANRQNGHVERSATEIVNENILIALKSFLQTVGQCRSRRFIDDTKDVETSDRSRIFRRLNKSMEERSVDLQFEFQRRKTTRRRLCQGETSVR